MTTRRALKCYRNDVFIMTIAVVIVQTSPLKQAPWCLEATLRFKDEKARRRMPVYFVTVHCVEAFK